MTKTFAPALVLTLALVAAPPALAKDKKPVDPNKKTCRADSADTGSIMPRRICHTAAEWAALDNAAGTGSRDDLRSGKGQGRPAGF